MHRPRLLASFVLVTCCMGAHSQARVDEDAIRALVQEEVAAWNAGNASAYARHFAADGTFVNIRGQYMSGAPAFTKQHEFLFTGPFHGSTLQQDIVAIQFPRADLAIVEVLTSVTGIPKLPAGVVADSKGRLRTRLSQIMEKTGSGEWKIVSYHNTDVKADVAVPEPGLPVADPSAHPVHQ